MNTLRATLARFPKASLGHHPTRLERLANIEADFPHKKLFIKRDDCNGLAFGGNKVRQLEYYLGQAKAENADCVLITGAVQSNFVRLAAAGANKLNMEAHIQLENRVPKDSVAYNNSGNVLVDKILGANIYHFAEGENEEAADNALHEIARELKAKGKTPYIIHLAPGHKPLGALGYVDAACELAEQLNEQQLQIDKFVVPSGSGNTHAGILFGLRALGIIAPVAGICVRRNARDQHQRIANRCSELAQMLEMKNPVSESDINLTDEFLQPGYGKPNATTKDAIKIAAQKEALITDPVYSGKTFAGFLDNARASKAGSSLLFWHTGGSPAVFGYPEDLSD